MSGVRTSGDYVLPATRAATVTAELRRLIQSGELPPGARLRQSEIAARFGTSTTPVREAFNTLAREGLVRHDPHRGVMVFAPDLDDLHENYEIRGALEPLATRLAASQLDEAQLDELAALVTRMRKEKNGGRYQDLNREFHRLIYQAANRAQLASLIDQLRDAADAYLRLALTGAHDAEYQRQVHSEHEEILAALKNHEGAKAEKLMAKHLQHNKARLGDTVSSS